MKVAAHSPDPTQGAFRALADPTRRDILLQLAEHNMTIGQLVDRYDMTRHAVKKHLIILEEGKLISVHTKGRERINKLEPVGLKAANDWFEHFDQFWSERLSKLKVLVEDAEARKQPPKLLSKRNRGRTSS